MNDPGNGKTRRVYGLRESDLIPPARSDAYHVPRVQSRVQARGGFLRNRETGEINVIPGFEGMLTMRDVEHELVEIARDNGTPADEQTVKLTEVGSPDGTYI